MEKGIIFFWIFIVTHKLENMNITFIYTNQNMNKPLVSALNLLDCSKHFIQVVKEVIVSSSIHKEALKKTNSRLIH